MFDEMFTEQKDLLLTLSVDGPFPNNVLGNALARQRDTITLRVCELRRINWNARFKPNSVKAQHRRLHNHHLEVRKHASIDFRRAYKQINTRVLALLETHKAYTEI